MNWTFKTFLGFCILLFLQSCSTTKNIPEGDSLYTGASIDIRSDMEKKEKQRVNSELQKLLKPKPNKKLFGLPLKLAFYNFMGNPNKTKGIKATLRRKFGEAPVLYSTANPIFIKEVLSSAMFNLGYFHVTTTYKVEQEGVKTSVTYLVNSGPGYRVKDYNFITTDTAVNNAILRSKTKPILKAHRHYSLDKLKDERVRIDEELKNQGYYYFSPDYLLFQVDSNEKNRELSLQLKIKDEAPTKALQKYTIRRTMVLMDSSYSFDSINVSRDTVRLRRVHLSLGKHFKPRPIAKYVFLKEGTLYSREDHQLTLNRLMGMGLFKYVNLSIEEVDSLGLEVMIHLSPLPKKSVTAEVQAVTKSNNFVGPRVNLSYTDRNWLRGGEKLTVSFHGSVETQLYGEFKGLYTYEIGPSVQLSFPRFITPFRLRAPRLFTPTTILGVDYDFTRRVSYFDMNSLKLSYMYKWKENIKKDHEFTPAYISVFNIRNVDSIFNRQLIQNPSLERRYEDQFIPGAMYSYTYNEQSVATKRNQLYFNGAVDVAGNVVGGLNQLGLGGRKEDGVRTFAGIAYAQFAKLTVDFRNYYHLSKRKNASVLVGRMYVGLGIPYGNSKALPYVKSFFSGGPYSIRAFTVNSLGPGTFRPDNYTQSLYFAQQGGDIKLEWNLEYRFPLISVLKGALFTDVGNTWLFNANSEVPGGQFLGRNLFNELGVGAGIGLRVDLSFFVIRLDVATPLRKPWLPEKERWVGQRVQFNDGAWRGENIIFNIAIGYPF